MCLEYPLGQARVSWARENRCILPNPSRSTRKATYARAQGAVKGNASRNASRGRGDRARGRRSPALGLTFAASLVLSAGSVAMPAITDSSTRAVPRTARIGAALLFVLAVASIIALAVYRLRRLPYLLDPVAAVRGVATTASVTVPAAVTTWP